MRLPRSGEQLPSLNSSLDWRPCAGSSASSTERSRIASTSSTTFAMTSWAYPALSRTCWTPRPSTGREGCLHPKRLCRNGVVLGQVKTDEKSNEITAIPELLEKLELTGCIVTVDAMGCQREIAKQIREGGGDYVLAVKGNQGNLEKEVVAYFESAREDDFDRPEIEDEVTSNEGHGRVEYRSYFLSTDLSSLTVGEKWHDLKAIGMVESERYSRDGVSFERRYYITSVDDIELFHQAVRSHWGPGRPVTNWTSRGSSALPGWTPRAGPMRATAGP